MKKISSIKLAEEYARSQTGNKNECQEDWNIQKYFLAGWAARGKAVRDMIDQTNEYTSWEWARRSLEERLDEQD